MLKLKVGDGDRFHGLIAGQYNFPALQNDFGLHFEEVGVSVVGFCHAGFVRCFRLQSLCTERRSIPGWVQVDFFQILGSVVRRRVF